MVVASVDTPETESVVAEVVASVEVPCTTRVPFEVNEEVAVMLPPMSV